MPLRQELGRPVLCGEAGVDLDREDIPFSMQLVEENLALFHKHGISVRYGDFQILRYFTEPIDRRPCWKSV